MEVLESTAHGRPPRIVQVVIGLGLLAAIGCDGCTGPDTVFITNESGHEIGLLVDGADTSGDFQDRTYETTDTEFEFDFDVLSRADDKEEIAAFVEGRPPFVRNPMYFHVGTDLASIPFENEIWLDFTVWIVDVNWANTVTNRTNETLDALAYADDRWREERMGIRCGNVKIVDKTADSDADDLRDCSDCDDDYFRDLADDIGFDSGRINIYLTRKAFDSRYYGVAEVGGDQIAMGMYTGSKDLLMHEIAHNFTLEHTDDIDTHFNSKNVAISVGSIWTKRKDFTEGQIFRCHMNPDSAINDTYAARSGLYTVDCGHSTSTTVECPKIQKRIWSDDGFPPN